MNSNGPSDANRRVHSLRDLAQDVPPPRDLWPSIAAQIASEPRTANQAGRGPLASRGMQWAALAAVVFALGVGIWIGRSVLPTANRMGAPVPVAANGAGQSGVVDASYVTDPRYQAEHAELMKNLEARVKSLPPITQKKVLGSLATLRKSITDIQAALGKDPGNALLQELLVNTYQDEMRVLTAVHDASDPGKEI